MLRKSSIPIPWTELVRRTVSEVVADHCIGSILATVLWLLVSPGFRYYVTNFGAYNATYGTVAGAIVLLLWFYVSGLAILIDGELNSAIELASPHRKAPGEKRPGERRRLLAFPRRAPDGGGWRGGTHAAGGRS